MLTLFKEQTSSSSSIMGNGPTSGEKHIDQQYEDNELLKKTLQLEGLSRTENVDGLIFFASTDKGRVIAEILEERGWSRTKDNNVTNFTIKWCLAHQVDWNQFQEGKQLINNIPGQLVFADKINLWYTTRDYLRSRRTYDGNHLQTFLPMTFVLDDENEASEFLRFYKKHNRAWICKPRYSYAGRGIYVISVNSDLNAIFKLSIGTGNRLQYQPRLSGYLMQEYISRPLLIKGRKFDIRVHWLVAWTKPLLVFYNHNASVVRLSLNLYREFDFDRATHLTNLSVQENHHRYAFSQEATGMTINQLNHYFNQCFRPFHPKMCQDWVLTVMQERMQTIIRHVIRASKDKLTRGAGQFGLFGCDFLLDENFRIWLLEINDNPGVGWGNPRLNTTTKPLFEETLNIVFECFDKYKKKQPLLPIQCLKNYQLIYNEDDDAEKLVRDDNQLFTERLSIRYATKENSTRTSFHRLLPRVNTSRTSTNLSDFNRHNNKSATLPLIETIKPIPTSIDQRPSKHPIADSMLSGDSTIDTTPCNCSTVTATSVSLASENITPLSSSIVAGTSVSLSTECTTSFSPNIVDPTPASSSLINLPSTHSDLLRRTSMSVVTVDSNPYSSSVVNPTDDQSETIEPFKHEDDIELERLLKPKKIGKTSKSKPSLPAEAVVTQPIIKVNKSSIKRTLPTTNLLSVHRKKRIDLVPIFVDDRRYTHQKTIVPLCTRTVKKEEPTSKNKTILKKDESHEMTNEDPLSVRAFPSTIDVPEVRFFH